jgi:hypothetical protein
MAYLVHQSIDDFLMPVENIGNPGEGYREALVAKLVQNVCGIVATIIIGNKKMVRPMGIYPDEGLDYVGLVHDHRNGSHLALRWFSQLSLPGRMCRSD